jgi:hypothetical protein
MNIDDLAHGILTDKIPQPLTKAEVYRMAAWILEAHATLKMYIDKDSLRATLEELEVKITSMESEILSLVSVESVASWPNYHEDLYRGKDETVTIVNQWPTP